MSQDKDRGIACQLPSKYTQHGENLINKKRL